MANALAVSNTVLHFTLNPSCLSGIDGIEKAINQELATYILKYIAHLNGVFLSWSKVKLLDTSSAATVWEFPHVHVRAEVELLLFRPQPGQKLEGIVTNIGQDYFALRILGYFPAICRRTTKTLPAGVVDGCKVRITLESLTIVGSQVSLIGVQPELLA